MEVEHEPTHSITDRNELLKLSFVIIPKYISSGHSNIRKVDNKLYFNLFRIDNFGSTDRSNLSYFRYNRTQKATEETTYEKASHVGIFLARGLFTPFGWIDLTTDADYQVMTRAEYDRLNKLIAQTLAPPVTPHITIDVPDDKLNISNIRALLDTAVTNIIKDTHIACAQDICQILPSIQAISSKIDKVLTLVNLNPKQQPFPGAGDSTTTNPAV